MACLEESFHPRQHHALAVAAEIARAQSGREHLAIHARQLALEPRLQILRRHPRSLLLRLEYARRHALENHVYRDQRLGLPGMTIKTWYKCDVIISEIAFSGPMKLEPAQAVFQKHEPETRVRRRTGCP